MPKMDLKMRQASIKKVGIVAAVVLFLYYEVFSTRSSAHHDASNHVASIPQFIETTSQIRSPNSLGQAHLVVGLLRLFNITPQLAVKTLVENIVSTDSNIVVVDVGAHEGQEALLSLKAGAKHVSSFEPDKRNCEKIRQVTSSYDSNRFQLYCGGVGDEDGIKAMSFHESRTDWSCFDCLKDTTGVKTEDIRVYKLDSVFADSKDKIFLKTDTQGHEFAVLKGSVNLIRAGRLPYVVLEFDPTLLEKAGTDPQEFLGWLFSHGYTCFDLKWEATEGSFNFPLLISSQSFATYLRHQVKYGYTDLFCIWSDATK